MVGMAGKYMFAVKGLRGRIDLSVIINLVLNFVQKRDTCIS